MSLPRFMTGMIMTIGAVAVAVFWMTGSIMSALVDATLSAVAIQTGYFLVVLFFIFGPSTTNAL